MPFDLPAAHTFIRANARLVELHVHATRFHDASTTPVVAALAAYQNPDGGFGHGLEPDTRSPHSQPLDVETAFATLVAVGADAPDMTRRACGFLATIAAADGAVPILLPTVDGHPMATHWIGRGAMPPAMNPTAGIAGLAHALGVRHPWVDAATEWCLTTIEAGDLPTDAHTYIGLARLLEHAPDRDRADGVMSDVAAAVVGSELFQLHPDPAQYGVTPLHVAPSPTHLARAWFTDDVVSAHLDALESGQDDDDGGWPIRWQPPGQAGVWEWRSIVTLAALTTLRTFGRLDHASATSER